MKILFFIAASFFLLGSPVFAVDPMAVPATEPIVEEEAEVVGFFVSPTGESTNDGSFASPWDLKTAFAHPAELMPGDTIYMRGGTYNGRFISTLTGTKANPITVRAYPGEHVVIDGNKTTTLAETASGSDPFEFDTIVVTDPDMFTPGVFARFGGISGEEMRIDEIDGNEIVVVRGWSGTSGVLCDELPAGTEARLYGDVLNIQGAHTNYHDMEITISGQVTRISSEAGSNPVLGGIEQAVGIVDQCAGCRYINNVIHDVSNGFGSFAVASSSTFYGNISYYNGWFDSIGEDGKGHGLYIQNTAGFPLKTVKHNIAFKNFNFSAQSYGDAGGIDNTTYDGNTFFDSGAMSHGIGIQVYFGRDPSFENPIFDNNRVFGSENGYNKICAEGTAGNNAKVRDNYFAVADTEVDCPSGMIATGNTFLGTTTLDEIEYPDNTFTGSFPGSGLTTFVDPNEYEPGRAHITVFNWSLANNVSVDISDAGLTAGNTYEVVDAQNYFGGFIASGTYTGASISIPMTTTEVPDLIGENAIDPAHTEKIFGVFVLTRT